MAPHLEHRPSGWCGRDTPDPHIKEARRVVRLGKPHTELPSNRISNTKYNPITFIPVNIAEQFALSMNRYFLLIACLQLISIITPVSPITTWLPLIIVFALTASKEWFDDKARQRADLLFNTKPIMKATAPDDPGLKSVASQDIMVGDIVMVRKDEELPCDLVVLKTSHPEGLAYSSTANLDGETDKKVRTAVAATQAKDLSSIDASIVCKPPSGDIHQFFGYLAEHDASVESLEALESLDVANKAALSIDNTLWQGTHLKDVDYVVGVVVYSGMETRVGMNRKKPEPKCSQVDLLIDKTSICIFCFQLTLVAVFGTTGILLNQREGEGLQNHYYLQWAPSGDVTSSIPDWFSPLVIPLRFLLLMSYMIPISLKVTLDFSNMYYAKLIEWDTDLYCDGAHAVARNSSITQDLGQVAYIMSDKTGTLTQNKMSFRACTVGGVAYESEAALQAAVGGDEQGAAAGAGGVSRRELLCSMALNCDLQVDAAASPGSSANPYSGVSPDEEELVGAARRLGVELLSATGKAMRLSVHGAVQDYEVLRVLAFSSDRKRMSVVLRHTQTGEIWLHCKGADEKIFGMPGENVPSRLRAEDARAAAAAGVHVDEFAAAGLRTLAYARRRLSEEQWEDFHARVLAADAAVQDRQEKQAAVYETIEQELQLLGATGIEDLLQERVADTIAHLRRANIRFWMLTGDKKSTAETIANTCKILQLQNRDEQLLDVSVSATRPEDRQRELGPLLQQLEERRDALLSSSPPRAYGIIITGTTLAVVLAHEEHTRRFTQLSLQASSVICSRVTPAQKAQVVGLIKDNAGQITLAVGDGGNDVSMIQKAHVGVGIVGKEGLQASRAADFAIGQFRYLEQLLLLHGRSNYQRTAFIAHYSFYKSMYFATIQTFYNCFAALSGQTLFNSVAAAGFNVIFTAAPILFYMFDRDVDKEEALSRPELYWAGQSFQGINPRTLLTWFAQVLYQGSLTTFGCVWLLRSATTAEGHPMIRQTLAYVAYSVLLLVLLLTLLINSHTLNKMQIYANAICFLSFYLVLFAYNAYSTEIEGHDVFNHTVGSWYYWLVFPLVSAAASLPFVAHKFIAERYFGSLEEHLAELALPTAMPQPPVFCCKSNDEMGSSAP